MQKDTKVKLILLFLLSLAVLKYVSLLELSGFWKLMLSITYLYITSLYVKRVVKDAKEELIPGLLMIRTRKWLEEMKGLLPLGLFLEVLSRVMFFSMFGLVALVLAKWLKPKEKIVYMIAGALMLYGLLISYPFALLKLGTGSGSGASPLGVMLAVGAGFLGIIVYSFGAALYRTISSILGGTEIPTTLTPLLPGITLPFFEGIIALGLALVIHELAHAILSLRYNIPLKSTGLLTYGVLPVGAFVEPDEESFERAESEKKINILLAGPSINIFSGLVLFGVFLLYIILTTPLAVEGCYVVKGAEPGTIIKTIDNIPCIYAFGKEGSLMETNHGSLSWNSSIYYYPIGKDTMIRYYDWEILNFFYNLFYMLFSLNLLLGLANLFPVMFFDGGQLIREVGRAWNKERLANAFVGVFSLTLLLLILASLI